MASTTSVLGLTKPAYTDDADIGDMNGNFDLIDAEAGRVRANFAGTYSTSNAYAVGAYVIYQGNLYKCTTAIGSGGEAWNSAHWDQVSVGTELTTLNTQIGKYAKLLWEGSAFTSGSLVVPNINQYRVVELFFSDTVSILVTVAGSNSIMWGGALFTTYGSNGITSVGCRYSYTPDSNTIAIDTSNRGYTDGTNSNYSGNTIGLIRVVGIA